MNVELNEYSTSIFNSVQIVDINGTVVAETLVNKNSKLHFNISNLPDGSYFVKGKGELGAKSIPFIIAR